MGLSDITEKLENYQQRLAEGKADKIKPQHVEKVIEKLTLRKGQLAEELEQAIKPAKRQRIKSKIARVEEQIGKAKWLATQI